jgi:hypothetical protein
MTDKLYCGAALSAHLNNQPNTFMRTHLQKLVSSLLLAGAAWLGGAYQSAAQLSVSPTGLAPQTFDSLPPVTSWSFRSTAGGAGDITTPAGMDAEVQTNSAALINAALVSTAGDPPAASANGVSPASRATASP